MRRGRGEGAAGRGREMAAGRGWEIRMMVGAGRERAAGEGNGARPRQSCVSPDVPLSKQCVFLTSISSGSFCSLHSPAEVWRALTAAAEAEAEALSWRS